MPRKKASKKKKLKLVKALLRDKDFRDLVIQVIKALVEMARSTRR